jgi:hypothetical protein
MPAGITFTAGNVAITPPTGGAQPFAAAYMMINLDPAYTPASAGLPTGLTAAPGADYSPGNAAGNKPGEYKFLVTSTDSNGYVQSIPVNIRIATPSPRSATTALAAAGTAGLTYMNGSSLSYSGTMSDVITLTNSSVLGATGKYEWKLTPVTSQQLDPLYLKITDPASAAAATGNIAALKINRVDTAGNTAPAGSYPYLISSLDSNNVVQTIFYTIIIA